MGHLKRKSELWPLFFVIFLPFNESVLPHKKKIYIYISEFIVPEKKPEFITTRRKQ